MTYKVKNQLTSMGCAQNPPEWLIVGLGNPGACYEKTRHNIGFMVVDALASQTNARFERLKAVEAEAALTRIAGHSVLLLKPLTYMNLSGEAVAPLAEVLELPVERVLVIVDEVALPFPQLRLRGKGSAGGQNGMKSIIRHLGGKDAFPRLRVGIGPQPERMPLEAFVLQAFTPEQEKQLSAVLESCWRGIQLFLSQGLEAAQTAINNKVLD